VRLLTSRIGKGSTQAPLQKQEEPYLNSRCFFLESGCGSVNRHSAIRSQCCQDHRSPRFLLEGNCTYGERRASAKLWSPVHPKIGDGWNWWQSLSHLNADRAHRGWVPDVNQHGCSVPYMGGKVIGRQGKSTRISLVTRGFTRVNTKLDQNRPMQRSNTVWPYQRQQFRADR
jgi:hypothetical protein